MSQVTCNSPDLRPRLVQGEAEAPHYEHVRVVPPAWPGPGGEAVLVLAVEVDDAQHRAPGVVNIVEVPPEVAVLRYRLVVRVLA